MPQTISDSDAYNLELNGLDPANLSTSLDDNTISPIAAIAASGGTQATKGNGTSPLTSSSLVNKLLGQSNAMAPDRQEVLNKRQALMGSYDRLMQAQQYQGSAVKDPAGLAFSSAILQANPNLDAMDAAMGKGFQNAGAVTQALADRKQQSGIDQANTGISASNANLGFLNSDQANSMDLLKQAGTADYKNEMINMRQSLAEIGKNKIVKDAAGNPIGVLDPYGKVQPLNGSSGNINAVGGTTPNGASILKIPGVDPNSPLTQGISQVIANTGIDPNSITNRTRPDIAASTKDAADARKLYEASQSAAQTAQEAEKSFANGTPGFIDKLEHGVNYYASSNLQGGKDYDLIEKYNKQIAASLAASMKNARIGVGMDKFLSGTTFNPGMSGDAAGEIIQNLKNAPYVAKANMDLENTLNQLPIAHKNAIYSEFVNDNPPYKADETGKYTINPVYKDPNMVKNWYAQKAGLTPVTPTTGTADPTAEISQEDAIVEAKRRGLIK